MQINSIENKNNLNSSHNFVDGLYFDNDQPEMEYDTAIKENEETKEERSSLIKEIVKISKQKRKKTKKNRTTTGKRTYSESDIYQDTFDNFDYYDGEAHTKKTKVGNNIYNDYHAKINKIKEENEDNQNHRQKKTLKCHNKKLSSDESEFKMFKNEKNHWAYENFSNKKHYEKLKDVKFCNQFYNSLSLLSTQNNSEEYSQSNILIKEFSDKLN